MSRKLLAIAIACGLGAAAPAWAANGPPNSAPRGQPNKPEKTDRACLGYSSHALKAACVNDKNRPDHDFGKGHCKGRGHGHHWGWGWGPGRGHGHGHDWDDDCPVSS